MKTQVIINIIYLMFIFVWQLTCKYKTDMVINISDNEIRTVREQSKVYINDHVFLISKPIEDIPTKGSRFKSALWYSVWGLYLGLMNLRLRKLSILPIHRLTFFLSAIYFFIFGFRLFLTIFLPKLYQIASISLNIFLSGTVIILFIFSILTFKSLKQ